MKTKETRTLTIPEVAELLGISRGLAYRMAKEGKIPVLYLGKRMLVTKSRLAEFLKQEA